MDQPLEAQPTRAAMLGEAAPMRLAVASAEIPRRIQAARETLQPVPEAEALDSASRA